MKNMILTLIFILSASFSGVFAQVSYTVDNSESRIIIEGTSSLHDWEMIAEQMNVSLNAVIEQNKVSEIKNVSFLIRSENLESDNSVMNKKAQDALKSNKYESIKFTLSDIPKIQTNGLNISGLVKGELFIAGKTKMVEIPFSGKLNGENSLAIYGEKKIRMSDFGIDPPRAMLGTLKTGDEINIKFDLEFTQDNIGAFSNQ